MLSDLKPMPRGVIVLAGAVILLLAVIGLYFGVMARGGKGSRYSDSEVADVIPTAKMANARALAPTGPVIDETQVRKWAREEAQGLIARPVVKKPDDAEPAPDPSTPDTAVPPPPLSAPTLSPPNPTAKPAGPG